jgi:hypothetical protein
VARNFGTLEEALEAVLRATASYGARPVDWSDVGALLGDLRASYTMERERAVHDGVARGLAGEKSSVGGERPTANDRAMQSGGEEDLGANVELF